MTLSPMMFVTSVPEAQLDDTCGMQLWYAKYQDGRGLFPKNAILLRDMLAMTQADLKIVARMEDIRPDAIQEMIDDVLGQLTVEERADVRAMELLYRRLGWMAAYALFIEPQIRKLYLTVAIDDEVDLDRDPLWVRVKTGRVLRHRSSQEIEHREYLPTHSISARWREAQEFGIGPHVALEAVRDALKRRIHWARITGLNLGFGPTSETTALHHPYVYGYRHKHTGEWTNQYKMASETEWQERPIWEYPQSLTDWVIKCGSNIAETQFPLSPKIPLNTTMLENWVERRLQREKLLSSVHDICHGNLHLRNMHFPQRTIHCHPVHAAPCVYKDVCWSEPFMASALQMTRFAPNGPKRINALPFEIQRPAVVVPPPAPLVRLSDLVASAIADSTRRGEMEVINGQVVSEGQTIDTSDVIDTAPI